MQVVGEPRISRCQMANLQAPCQPAMCACLPALSLRCAQARCVRCAATCARPHSPAWTTQPTAHPLARAAAAARRGGPLSSSGGREVCHGLGSASAGLGFGCGGLTALRARPRCCGCDYCPGRVPTPLRATSRIPCVEMSHDSLLFAGAGLSVEVVEPHDGSRPARFTFKGRASEADLHLMAAALAGAMQTRRRGPVDVRADGGRWVVRVVVRSRCSACA